MRLVGEDWRSGAVHIPNVSPGWYLRLRGTGTTFIGWVAGIGRALRAGKNIYTWAEDIYTFGQELSYLRKSQSTRTALGPLLSYLAAKTTRPHLVPG